MPRPRSRLRSSAVNATMHEVTFTGQDAVRIARVAKRPVEVRSPPGWRTQPNSRVVAQVVANTPNRVRLRMDARVLLESLTAISVNTDADLSASTQYAITTTTNPEIKFALTQLEKAL